MIGAVPAWLLRAFGAEVAVRVVAELAEDPGGQDRAELGWLA